jgi:DNA repair protein RadC
MSVTTKLKEAGRILGIPIEDHVIVGEVGYFSFRQQGLL